MRGPRESARGLALLLPLVAALGASSSGAEAPRPHRVELLSPVFTIDRVYTSMRGPTNTQELRFEASDPEELLWLTGYHVEVVGPDGATPVSADFLCHNNLEFDPEGQRRLVAMKRVHDRRIFTLTEGQTSVRLPEGFGMPVLAEEVLRMTAQTLNHNVENTTLRVRQKVTVEYYRDSELETPLQPLFVRSVYTQLPLEEGDPTDHVYHEHKTGHWTVGPGRDVRRTNVTDLLNLGFDTTLHAVAVHVHPFNESVELRDVTRDETVFRSVAENFDDRIGLAHIQYFSSPEGIPLSRDHEYELISTYDNTSGRDQTAMATMFLYLLDPDFTRAPRPAVDPARGAEIFGRALELAEQERPADAVAELDHLIRLLPNHAGAYYLRGLMQLRRGDAVAAVADLSAAIDLQPGFGRALNQRAWLEATWTDPAVRNGARAVESATRACEITGFKDPTYLDTLAAAHAEAGDFEEAVKWQARALELAKPHQQDELGARLALYRSGKPHREGGGASDRPEHTAH